MFEFIFKIWYMMVVLPFLIFLEGNKMFSNFLKKKNIYLHWDVFHSFLFILIILYIILWVKGYR
ncbi:MAG: hypothetical protein US41_C0027G0002 [Parcubacteria group bacterium GW2011_GWB1_37_13]|uniref:Uncharacterized protein n=1 Tax=Candidatus Yanofskybacteria bacterium GW2011_GWC2_37_9 TaxID=1619028 RepID=A0A0G0HTX5_9BACT|nr:MAG: hypothetical protein US41_C0027G0002 [Parcubacteria group bacterium GW2011_GWB1_37_13]KKQ45712.1 MAG: hypothetical protein US65_C0050G0003 [Candidatus Yanofskybacteria bacterium GW2011_GWC2_37_9]